MTPLNTRLCDNFPKCTGTAAAYQFPNHHGRQRHLCSACMDDYLHLRERQQIEDIKSDVRLIHALGTMSEGETR